ncbi:MAG: TolC family protein [Candidatus Riflebacteria bacterium]|nr:TolC family protein [Candidatus Riflebacteria bacterium]
MAGHYPVVSLIARQGERDAQGTLFGGGSDVVTDDFVVRVDLPIYQGEFVMAKTREASKLAKSAAFDRDAKTRSARRQARSAFLGINAAIQRVQALQEAIRHGEIALAARQEGYRSGLYTVVPVLDAERDLYSARRDHAQARYDYLLKSLLLSQAVGTLGESDLSFVERCVEPPAAVSAPLAAAALSGPAPTRPPPKPVTPAADPDQSSYPSDRQMYSGQPRDR